MAVRYGNPLVALSARFILGAKRHGNAIYQEFHVKRGQAYTHHITEEELYNRDFRTQVPQFQRMPAAIPASHASFAMPPLSNGTLMQNGTWWGGFNAPPSPVSNHVQIVQETIYRVQCMNSVQAELMLKLAAAQQGPYTD
ncbi:unnamed protein product [Symbiodinium sp. KB8]|nr:unnamed protein product [Symbiodinium sp. KB8]